MDGGTPEPSMTTDALTPSDASPVTSPEPPAPETSVTTKIVRIEGEHFSVPYAMPISEIRENLQTTYPGIRTATVATGVILIADVRYETVEFSKQAGTKGAGDDPHPLHALLALPRLPLGPIPNLRIVQALRHGAYTFAEALDLPLFMGRSVTYSGEAALCPTLDALPAVASGPDLTVPGWSA